MSIDQTRLQQLELLQTSAVKFVSKKSPLARARALRASSPGFDRQFWNALVDQGWIGMLIPEALGGHGQGVREMAAVASALSAQLAPEPLTPVAVFSGRLLQACTDSEMACRLLAETAKGHLMPAVAWQEDASGRRDFGGGGQPEIPATTSVDQDGMLSVTGGKRHVRPGSAADGYIVTAASAGGLVLIWVPAEAAGLARMSERLADGTYADRLVFEQVRVGESHLLARGSVAQGAFAAAYDETLVLASVEMLALARRMLTMTLDYLRVREQFGKPIGSFQALQHRAVDLLIQQELSASVVAEAISLIDHGVTGVERARMGARVKARCSEAALKIAAEAIQMHGAIGITDECDLGMYLQRTLVLSAWLGNADLQRGRFAALGGCSRLPSDSLR